jgi:hypothetical protein
VGRIIAYQGDVELLNASWSLDSGRIVEFGLVESDDDPERVHPFKLYQRRRGGRIGQLFHAVIVDTLARVVYDGMLQLASWSDTDRGKSARFWIDEDAERHPFAGYDKRTRTEPGSKFTLVLVQLTDDNKPVDQVALAREEALERARGQRKLSAEAHLMVTGERFLQYLQNVAPPSKGQPPWTADRARRWVKWRLGISSLSMLDSMENAGKRFHEEIRKPFAAWSDDE